MKLNKKLEQMKEEFENVKIPENGMEGLMNSIERGKRARRMQNRNRQYKGIGGCAAAALAVLVLLPNMSSSIAMAMEKVPVLGSVIRVTTFGRYDFDDERHHANVEIPEVELQSEGETNAQAEELEQSLNQDIETYINRIVEDFKSSLDTEAVNSVDITYDVVTDTEDWFTLKLNVLEVQASGYMYSRYYNINKETGERAELKDLFQDGSDYAAVISENIKEQMRDRMKADESQTYFISGDDTTTGEGFTQVKEDQNFYFDENGQLVIVFDEYEVAPGYMGIVEFTIPDSVTEEIRK